MRCCVGRGLYFAENASYSDNGYVFQSNNVKQLLLCDVIVGDYIDLPPNSSIARPPRKDNGEGWYDSVTGTTGGSRVFIGLDVVYVNSGFRNSLSVPMMIYIF